MTPVEEPDQPPSGTAAPLADLRKSAGSGIAKAAGVDGADVLWSRDSSSDGSLSGDSRELVGNTAAGARLGAKVGAAPGAAVGAVAGSAVTAVTNKRTRRRLVMVLTAPMVAGVLAWTMVIVALGSMVTDRDQTRDGMSQAAALADGVTDDQVEVYRAAADSSEDALIATGRRWKSLSLASRHDLRGDG